MQERSPSPQPHGPNGCRRWVLDVSSLHVGGGVGEQDQPSLALGSSLGGLAPLDAPGKRQGAPRGPAHWGRKATPLRCFHQGNKGGGLGAARQASALCPMVPPGVTGRPRLVQLRQTQKAISSLCHALAARALMAWSRPSWAGLWSASRGARASVEGEGEAGTPAHGVEAAQCSSDVRWGLGWSLRAQVRVGGHSERERERGREEAGSGQGSGVFWGAVGTTAPAVLDLCWQEQQVE